MLKRAVLGASLCVAGFGAAQAIQGPASPTSPSDREALPAGDLQLDIQRPADSPKDRQPGWIDENAIPTAGRLPGTETREAQISANAPDIRRYLSRLTNAVISPGGIRVATSLLDERDRQRIEEDVRNLPDKPHDDIVRDFRAQFQVRYGEGFDLSRQQVILSDYLVLRGLRSADEAILASNELRPTLRAPSTSPAPAASQQQDLSATLVVPGNPDLKQPAIVLTLNNRSQVRPDWHLDVPGTLDPHRLQSAIDERLVRLLDGRLKWPATAAEAYRLVTYNILASFSDQPLDRPPEPTQPAKPPSADNPSIAS